MPYRVEITVKALADIENARIKIRQLLIGKREGVYRVLFVIEEETVYILRIRHGARGRLEPDELR